MTKPNHSAIFFILILTFSGCSRNPIESVQSGTLSIDRSVTIKNILENYSDFSNKEWSYFIDKNNRSIVKFTGTFNYSFLGYFQQAMSKATQVNTDSLDNAMKLTSYINKHGSLPDDIIKHNKEEAAKIQNFLSKIINPQTNRFYDCTAKVIFEFSKNIDNSDITIVSGSLHINIKDGKDIQIQSYCQKDPTIAEKILELIYKGKSAFDITKNCLFTYSFKEIN